MMGLRLLAIALLVLAIQPAAMAQQQNATMTIPELEELLTRNVWILEDYTFSFTSNKTYARKQTVAGVSSYNYGTWEVSECCSTCIELVMVCAWGSHLLAACLVLSERE
jgi:hypothetical protein